MPQPPASWKELLGAHPQGDLALKVLVLMKLGEPLLIVPAGQNARARDQLALFPAQKLLARLARFAWRWTLPLGFAPGGRKEMVRLDRSSALGTFLGSLVRQEGWPQFVLLAGNPRAPGRRFLLLVFDANGHPAAVVKAGCDAAAAALIDQEATFLEQSDGRIPGIPRLRARFAHGITRAFALDYVPGDSPGDEICKEMAQLLNAWLRQDRRVRLGDLPAWQRLEAVSSGDAVFRQVAAMVAKLEVRPAVFHGDFAPWNVKVSPADGSWRVLDWERAVWEDVPGWDWFHFRLQTALLVREQNAAGLVNTAEALLAHPAYQAYSAMCGTAGHDRAWLLAYLLHCRDVLQPVDGDGRVGELLNLLAQRWLKH